MFGHSQRTAFTIAASLAEIGEVRVYPAGDTDGIQFTAAGRTNAYGRGDPVDYAQPGTVRTTEKYLASTETLEEQTLEEAIEEEKQIPVGICNHALLVG
ncbi:hypothetical protein ACNKHM_04580 [Shigella sonnei]